MRAPLNPIADTVAPGVLTIDFTPVRSIPVPGALLTMHQLRHLRDVGRRRMRRGAANGHHLVNQSKSDVSFLEVGTRADIETVEYTDPAVNMRALKDGAGWRFVRRNGEAW